VCLFSCSPAVSKAKLKEAHKRIMLLNHPDRGTASSYCVFSGAEVFFVQHFTLFTFIFNVTVVNVVVVVMLLVLYNSPVVNWAILSTL